MRTNRGWSGPTVSYLGNIFPQPKGHGLLALYTGIVCAPASNPTLQDHHNLCRGSPSCCKIFCTAAFFLEPHGMRIPHLHKQLVALILVSSCPCIFPLPVTSFTLALHSKFTCNFVNGTIERNSWCLKFPSTHWAFRIWCGFGELSKGNQTFRMATAQADGL